MIREDGVLTPHCPMCGHVGMMMPNVANAWCTGGDDCPVIMWNPYRPAAEQLPGVEPTIVGSMLCANCARVVDVRDVAWVADDIAVCGDCLEATR